MTLNSGVRPSDPYCNFLCHISLLLIATQTVGCGDSQPLRIPGSGNVKVAGDAVDDFTITFVPDTGVGGPAASAPIKNGAYQFTTKDGPAKPGSYRVMIQEPVVPVSRPERMRGVQPIKERTWNVNFTVPEKGPFSKDFDLE